MAGARQPSPGDRALASKSSSNRSDARRDLIRQADADAVVDAPATVRRYWRPQGDSNPCYRRERAMSWASRRWGPNTGGARRDRTADLLHAMQALSQLSYGPTRSRRKLRSGQGVVKPGRAKLSRVPHRFAQTYECDRAAP